MFCCNTLSLCCSTFMQFPNTHTTRTNITWSKSCCNTLLLCCSALIWSSLRDICCCWCLPVDFNSMFSCTSVSLSSERKATLSWSSLTLAAVSSTSLSRSSCSPLTCSSSPQTCVPYVCMYVCMHACMNVYIHTKCPPLASQDPLAVPGLALARHRPVCHHTITT